MNSTKVKLEKFFPEKIWFNDLLEIPFFYFFQEDHFYRRMMYLVGQKKKEYYLIDFNNR